MRPTIVKVIPNFLATTGGRETIAGKRLVGNFTQHLGSPARCPQPSSFLTKKHDENYLNRKWVQVNHGGENSKRAASNEVAKALYGFQAPAGWSTTFRERMQKFENRSSSVELALVQAKSFNVKSAPISDNSNLAKSKAQFKSLGMGFDEHGFASVKNEKNSQVHENTPRAISVNNRGFNKKPELPHHRPLRQAKSLGELKNNKVELDENGYAKPFTESSADKNINPEGMTRVFKDRSNQAEHEYANWSNSTASSVKRILDTKEIRVWKKTLANCENIFKSTLGAAILGKFASEIHNKFSSSGEREIAYDDILNACKNMNLKDQDRVMKALAVNLDHLEPGQEKEELEAKIYIRCKILVQDYNIAKNAANPNHN